MQAVPSLTFEVRAAIAPKPVDVPYSTV